MSNESKADFTVYTTPICVQCTATKREITKAGGTYEEIDLSAPEQAELLEEFRAGGGAIQMPIVVSGQNQWQGFRPDLIKYVMKNKEIA